MNKKSWIAVAGALLGGLLYRLRGGLFKTLAQRADWEWGGRQPTQLMRLIWAVPTGLLLFFGTTPDTEMWYRALLCIVMVFASMALLGHGAHMVFDISYWKERWAKGEKINVTEIHTGFWLPYLFGGSPDSSWSNTRYIAYSFIGMGVTGILRNAITMAPFWVMMPWFALWYTLFGTTHASCYLLGEYFPKPKDYNRVEVGEFLVGASTWLFIVDVLYLN
jgi:hypothetical protein